MSKIEEQPLILLPSNRATDADQLTEICVSCLSKLDTLNKQPKHSVFHEECILFTLLVQSFTTGLQFLTRDRKKT